MNGEAAQASAARATNLIDEQIMNLREIQANLDDLVYVVRHGMDQLVGPAPEESTLDSPPDRALPDATVPALGLAVKDVEGTVRRLRAQIERMRGSGLVAP